MSRMSSLFVFWRPNNGNAILYQRFNLRAQPASEAVAQREEGFLIACAEGAFGPIYRALQEKYPNVQFREVRR